MGWAEERCLQRNIDIPDDLLALILCAAASLRESESHLTLTRRELRTRVTKCIEVDGATFQHLL